MSALSISKAEHCPFPHLEHPSFTAAYEVLEALVQDSFEGGAEILPIVGPSRVGKTHLIDRAKAALEPTELSHLRETRILYVRVPAIRSLKELLAAILGAMGLSSLTKGSTGNLESRVHRQMEKLGTRVLVLDEIQHLGEYANNAQRRIAADVLKVLHDKLRVSIVFMGLPRGLEIVDTNEQLQARSNAPVFIRPYCWTREGDIKAFASAIHSIERWIKENGGRTEVNFDVLTRGAYYATGGCVGQLGKLFGEFGQRQGMILDKAAIAKRYRKAFYRTKMLFDPFSEGPVEDGALIRVQQGLLKKAGLPIEFDSDFAKISAPKVA